MFKLTSSLLLQSREREDSKRCVLPATWTLMCARQPCVVFNDGAGQGTSHQDAAQSQDGQRNKYCTTHKLNFPACPFPFRGLNKCWVRQGPSCGASVRNIVEQVLPCLLSPQETTWGSDSAGGGSATVCVVAGILERKVFHLCSRCTNCCLHGHTFFYWFTYLRSSC